MNETIWIRVDEDSADETIEALTELVVKLWLISQDRTEDLIRYDAGDKSYEQEARAAGVFSIRIERSSQ